MNLDQLNQRLRKDRPMTMVSLRIPEDVIEFGMIPEFVGRVPVITVLAPLDEAALIDILTKPKNALIRQYQKFFEMENSELEFTDDALRALAKKALKHATGARALRSLAEELMIDLMYQLPEEPKPAEPEPAVNTKKK